MTKAETIMEKIAVVPKKKLVTLIDVFGMDPAKSPQSYTYNDMSKFNNMMANATGVPGN